MLHFQLQTYGPLVTAFGKVGKCQTSCSPVSSNSDIMIANADVGSIEALEVARRTVNR